jgi:hypothetical protein
MIIVCMSMAEWKKRTVAGGQGWWDYVLHSTSLCETALVFQNAHHLAFTCLLPFSFSFHNHQSSVCVYPQSNKRVWFLFPVVLSKNPSGEDHLVRIVSSSFFIRDVKDSVVVPAPTCLVGCISFRVVGYVDCRDAGHLHNFQSISIAVSGWFTKHAVDKC